MPPTVLDTGLNWDGWLVSHLSSFKHIQGKLGYTDYPNWESEIFELGELDQCCRLGCCESLASSQVVIWLHEAREYAVVSPRTKRSVCLGGGET